MPKLNRKKVHPRGILKEFPPTHVFSDGLGGLWTHEGTGAECRKPDCVASRDPRPWGYSDEHAESWADGPVRHFGPFTKFCVLCLSGEHVDMMGAPEPDTGPE